MAYVIREKHPGGAHSVSAIIKLIDGQERFYDNALLLWELLQPEINKSIKYEFSVANPNSWTRLKAGTVKNKRRLGFPDTIGVMSGTLKDAMTDDAKIKKSKKKLRWGINENLRGWKGKSVSDYAYAFHYGYSKRNQPARPIMEFTKKHLRTLMRTAVKIWIKRGKSERSR
jgi:hypothetical protein